MIAIIPVELIRYLFKKIFFDHNVRINYYGSAISLVSGEGLSKPYSINTGGHEKIL